MATPAAPSASAPTATTDAPSRVEPPAPALVGGTTASVPYVAPPPVTAPASAAAPEATAPEPVTATPPAPPLLGGDRDAHGCIGSAGYSWCEAKQKCLRPWEEKCE